MSEQRTILGTNPTLGIKCLYKAHEVALCLGFHFQKDALVITTLVEEAVYCTVPYYEGVPVLH
jgi:hypothetical protein